MTRSQLATRSPLEAAEAAYRQHIEGRPMVQAAETYLAALLDDTQILDEATRAVILSENTKFPMQDFVARKLAKAALSALRARAVGEVNQEPATRGTLL